MSDVEICRTCAELMGFPHVVNPGGFVMALTSSSPIPRRYDPLNNDAQAMELQKRFGLGPDNRAICEAVISARKAA